MATASFVFDKRFLLTLLFIKEKEVFMQSTDHSWTPSVGIA
jgi:hypothetical protein